MKTLISLTTAVLVLVMGSIGVAINDDGGGGGGAYTAKTPAQLQKLLREYKARQIVLRHAASGPGTMTLEAEMQHLHEEAFRAQVALRRAKAVATP